MSCPNYTFRQGDFYCMKKKDYVPSDIYYKYCRNYDYDRCSVYKYQESSGCFITTVTCEILGCQDDSKVMNDLRKFRDEVLQKDEKYYDVLKEYDVIGPKLADSIRKDKDRDIMARGLYQNVLVPVSYMVEQNDYDKAVETYYLMTLMLVNYYGKKHEYNSIKDNGYAYNDFEPGQAGHGRRLVK